MKTRYFIRRYNNYYHGLYFLQYNSLKDNYKLSYHDSLDYRENFSSFLSYGQNFALLFNTDIFIEISESVFKRITNSDFLYYHYGSTQCYFEDNIFYLYKKPIETLLLEKESKEHS